MVVPVEVKEMMHSATAAPLLPSISLPLLLQTLDGNNGTNEPLNCYKNSRADLHCTLGWARQGCGTVYCSLVARPSGQWGERGNNK